MRVIIIDDDSLVTLSLKTILEQSDIDVVAIENDGAKGLKIYQQYQPDIVLMDIRMNNTNGIDISKQIIEYDKNAKILLLTTFKDDEYISQALEIGVKGYLLKQDYQNLAPALNAIYANQSVFVEDIASKLFHLKSIDTSILSEAQISEKEFEVIELIAQGLNNKEISAKLFLSEGTIRNYISSILLKLELRDRTQIAIFYHTKIRK